MPARAAGLACCSLACCGSCLLVAGHGLKAVAREQVQNVLSAMPQECFARPGFHQAEPTWRHTELPPCVLLAAGPRYHQRKLNSRYFCGDRSLGIYSESHLPAANNVRLGVLRA